MIKLKNIKCNKDIAIVTVVVGDKTYTEKVDCVRGIILSKSNDLNENTAKRVRNKLVNLFIETGGHLPKESGIMTH